MRTRPIRLPDAQPGANPEVCGLGLSVDANNPQARAGCGHPGLNRTRYEMFEKDSGLKIGRAVCD